MKRRICVLLALAVCLGLGTPALADGAAEAAEAGADNILPDAWAFFGQEIPHQDTAIINGRRSNFMIGISNLDDDDLLAALEEYAALLQSDRFGLTLKESGHSTGYGTSAYYTFDYPGAGEESEIMATAGHERRPADVILNLQYMFTYYDVDIYFSDALTVADTGDRCTDARLVNSSGNLLSANRYISGPMGCGAVVLPDAWTFFNRELTHEDDIIDNGKDVFFEFDPDPEQLAAAFEYAELLQSDRFGFTLVSTEERDYGDGYSTVFMFDHPSIGEANAIKEDRLGEENVPADVIVRIDDMSYMGWNDINISFSDALTVMDTGDRCTFTGFTDRLDAEHGAAATMGSWTAISHGMSFEDNSGDPTVSGEGDASAGANGGSSRPSSSDSADDDDDDDIYSHGSERKKCSHCGGDGTRDCLTCGGKGYIEEYVSVPNYSGSTLGPSGGWEHHDCPNFNCHNGQVDCSYCGGDGWLD